MIGIIVCLILIYWIALYFFFRKSRHYYFQRYLYFFIIQVFLLAGIIDAKIWCYFSFLNVSWFWWSLFCLYFIFFSWQAYIAILKSFPSIATLEWWEAFHLFNLNNFLREISDQKLLYISNKDWLLNQNTKFLYRFSKALIILNYLYNIMFYFFFTLVLLYFWTLDVEYIWFYIDYIFFMYYKFLPLFFIIFLFLNSIFLQRIKKNYLVVAFSIIFEPVFVDRAAFDTDFGLFLNSEEQDEYQMYPLQNLYLRCKESHKKRDDLDYNSLSVASELTRLIWNDIWWDCNNRYYSRIFFKKKI